jgi:hypothetical protein
MTWDGYYRYEIQWHHRGLNPAVWATPFEFTSGELLSPEEAIAQARGRLDGCEGLGGSGVVIVEGSLKRFKITEEEIK